MSLFVALPQADISHFMRQFSPNSPRRGGEAK
jgi:hypothetical protein